MKVDEFLRELTSDPAYAGQVVAVHELPARAGTFVDAATLGLGPAGQGLLAAMALTRLYAHQAAALAGLCAFEIVYVNDGSSDGTEAELTGLMATRPWLRQIKHAASCGQSAAVRLSSR